MTKKKTALKSDILIHLPQKDMPKDSVLSFGAVIKKYRLDNGLTQNELAQVMCSSRNTIVNWETDKSRPEIDAIKKLCTLLGIPLYELFGLSNASIPSPKENTLLRQYRKLSNVSKRVVDSTISFMLQEEENSRYDMLREDFFILPFHPTPVAAGPGCEFVDDDSSFLFIKKNGSNTSADAIVRVSGSSMEPLYHNDDLVYIKYADSAEDGNDVVCSTADGAVIKRLMNHKLYSLNKDLPFGEKSEDDNVRILGVVLGIVSDTDQANKEDIPVLQEIHSQEIREFENKRYR